MDRSAIGSILPVFGIPVAAFGTVIPCGKLQTLIPTVSEEGTFPMCTFLLSHVFFFFISPLLLLVLTLLTTFLFLLMMPFIEEDARSYPRFGRFTHFNLTFQEARLFFVNLFKYDLLSWIN
jgi:hypothetical protein